MAQRSLPSLKTEGIGAATTPELISVSWSRAPKPRTTTSLLIIRVDGSQDLLYTALQNPAMHTQKIRVEVDDTGKFKKRQDKVKGKTGSQIFNAERNQSQSQGDRHEKEEKHEMNNHRHAFGADWSEGSEGDRCGRQYREKVVEHAIDQRHGDHLNDSGNQMVDTHGVCEL